MADQDLDVAIGQALGDLDLVEIFRGVVVDRRPEQVAQVGHFGGGRELGRMSGDVGELLLVAGGKLVRNPLPA